jgi:hypothetical protein
MATIAKLDRNGIEVVPEGQKTVGAGDSPLVDSSTGLDEGAGPSHLSLPQPVSMLIDGEPVKPVRSKELAWGCLKGLLVNSHKRKHVELGTSW